MGALLRQQSGNLFTNSPAGAGDQGNLALKIKKGGTHYYSPDIKRQATSRKLQREQTL